MRFDKQASRKALQLCAQVQHALHGALAACADPVLQSVTVVEVQPAPHSGRLRVLATVPDDGTIPLAVAAEHLAKAAGRLRAEVAAAICRRAAPELTFAMI